MRLDDLTPEELAALREQESVPSIPTPLLPIKRQELTELTPDYSGLEESRMPDQYLDAPEEQPTSSILARLVPKAQIKPSEFPMKRAMSVAKPAPASAASPSPESEFAAAQRARNEGRLMALLGQAGSQIGGALAAVGSGGVTAPSKPDTEIFKQLYQQAGTPLEDLKARREDEMGNLTMRNKSQLFDPNSAISQQYRGLLKKAFPAMKVPNDVSAGQLEQSGMVDLAKVMALRELMQHDKALAREAKLETEKNAKATQLAPKIQNKQYQDMVKLRAQAELMYKALTEPNPQRDITAVYSFINALDPQSTVREGEIAFTQSARGVPTSIKMGLQRMLKGDILSPAERKNMFSFIKDRSDIASKEWELSAKPYLNQADKLGINRDLVAPGTSDLGQASTQDPKITQFAESNGLSYEQAAKILEKRGYKGGQ